ncbi:MAG: hypothetical protein NTV05_11030 [Acidobacteria bacterium]|nr:hypothetical protein [Acidobacteriota bacterium]
MRHSWLVVVALCCAVVLADCTNKKPLPPVAPSAQGAAMQLGLAAGSFVAQAAQPMELRKESAVGFSRSESDLFTFMGRLQIAEAEAAGVASGMLDGFADPNPTRGSQLISDAMNDVMARLEASSYPELLWAFKVGFTIGHMGETVNVLTRGIPQEEHVQPYATLTTRDRETLQADLDQSGLPAELYDAIQTVPVEIRSVSDLFAITRACLKIRVMAAQMR